MRLGDEPVDSYLINLWAGCQHPECLLLFAVQYFTSVFDEVRVIVCIEDGCCHGLVFITLRVCDSRTTFILICHLSDCLVCMQDKLSVRLLVVIATLTCECLHLRLKPLMLYHMLALAAIEAREGVLRAVFGPFLLRVRDLGVESFAIQLLWSEIFHANVFGALTL